MLKTGILLLVAITPILILLGITFGKDKIEKEPILLLLRLFVAGMLACFIVLPITRGLSLLLNTDNILYISFIKVGFLEEICKWLCVCLIAWKSKEFDYKFDAIVYCIFVSLGFAFIENIGYALSYGITTALFRAIISVPCHAFFAIYMGYYMGIAKQHYINNQEGASTYVLCSIFIPVALHGIYNCCLTGGNDGFYLLFIVFLITLYVLSFKTINFASSIDSPLDQNQASEIV